MAQFKVEGMEELSKTLEKYKKKVDPPARTKISYEAAKAIVTPAVKAAAPMGPTGNLKNSIITKEMPPSKSYPGIAITAVDRKIAPHAHLVERGSSKNAARPFFRPAVSRTLPIARKAMESALKAVMR